MRSRSVYLSVRLKNLRFFLSFLLPLFFFFCSCSCDETSSSPNYLGSFEDSFAVFKAFEGVYGAWVNTDGFTVGEQKEIYCGMRIFEVAKQCGWVKHYVWSSLDYGFKVALEAFFIFAFIIPFTDFPPFLSLFFLFLSFFFSFSFRIRISKLFASQKGNYNPAYRCEHYDGKARVAEWIKSQPSSPPGGGGMSWTIITSCPYMDMLFNASCLYPLSLPKKTASHLTLTPLSFPFPPPPFSLLRSFFCFFYTDDVRTSQTTSRRNIRIRHPDWTRPYPHDCSLRSRLFRKVYI